MSDAEQRSMGAIEVDQENLYREEIFTDLRVATLRRLTPVKADGSDDPSRPTLFVGQTTLMSQAGPVPVQCSIEAATLEDAIAQFPTAVNIAIEQMIEEAREIQREEASRIVVPGRDVGGKVTLT